MTRKRPERRAAGRSASTASDARDAAAETRNGRVDLVDAARGVAITMMIAYHVCFDLTYYRWADWPMLDDPRWIAWRSAIVTAFLLVVGVSLALRDDRDRRRGTSGWFDRSFVRRWAQVAGAAALVTAGSAVLFPATFIYFGVLHFVAVAVWLCRRAPRLGKWAMPLGLAVLVLGLSFADPAFDPRPVDWIGFAARKPPTEDYVPLFPWLGVVLIGCGLGASWARHRFRRTPLVESAWLVVPLPVRRTLALMGRWSLTIYLLHQPLLLGGMGAIKAMA